MTHLFKIQPDSIRTDVPVTITADAKEAIVSPRGIPGADAFRVPIRDGQGQFHVSLPGDYEVTISGTTQLIHVAQQQDLDFLDEFVIFFSVCFILVGGMHVWLKKRDKRRRAASAARSI